jgi:hypothetical protein
MAKSPSWSGTSSELLAALIAEGASPNLLPKAPNAVSHEMNRAAPVLRRLGIHYHADPNTRKRTKYLERVTAPSTEKSATTATAATAAELPSWAPDVPGSDDDGSGGSDHPDPPSGSGDVDPDEIERLAELAERIQREAAGSE